MKKWLILLLIVGILYLGYEYFKPEEEHGPEVIISAHTKMDSGLWDNKLTKPYLTDNVLFVSLNPKKDYTNLSLNVISKGLVFVPPQANYFDLTKKHVFKFKITVKPEYNVGSKVDYQISVTDNSQPNSITTKSFEYEVGNVKFLDIIWSFLWAIAMIIFVVLLLILVLVSANKNVRREVSQLSSSILANLISKFF